MIRVSVYYPAGEGAVFDHAYYESTHRQLVERRLQPMGLVGIQVERGMAGLDGGPARFMACGHLHFDTAEQVEAALAAHGEELLGDIPNYTNIQPIIQLNSVVIDLPSGRPRPLTA